MKTLKKIALWCSAAAAVVLLASLALVLFFSSYKRPLRQADAIIILGAALNTPALYNRTLTGYDLYRQGWAGELVLSGGRISSRYVSEASNMQHVIESQTASPPPLVLEEESHNTYENIKNSRVKIPAAKSVIVVSDRFHLARSVLLAKRLGFETVYWAAPDQSYYRTGELFFYYAREVLAMVEYLPKFVKG